MDKLNAPISLAKHDIELTRGIILELDIFVTTKVLVSFDAI